MALLTGREIHEWERFWFPEEDPPDSPGHYLSNPRSWPELHPKLQTLREVLDSTTRIAVLLGSGGLGKTIEMMRLADEVGNEEKRFAQYLELSTSNDTSTLETSFNHIADKLDHHESSYLLLDSLGESAHQLLDVRAAIRRSNVDLQSVRVGIACRDTDLKPKQKVEAQQTLGRDVSVFRLAPLRRCDVDLAAERHGIDADAFQEDVANCKLEALAVNPQSLQFLIETYEENDQLPDSKYRLYRQGCRRLLKSNSKRLDSNSIRTSLTVDNRLKIAGRIAAAIQFSGNDRITFQAPHEYEGVPAVSIYDIADGLEDEKFASSAVEAVRETLRTSLFERVNDREEHFRFIHRSLGEFLGAHYTKKALEEPSVDGINSFEKGSQVRNLFEHSKRQDRLAEHLQSVAAWLGSRDPTMRQLLLDWAPHVLDRVDYVYLPEDACESILTTLLQEAAQRRYSGSRQVSWTGIEYPEISADLRDYLGKSVPEQARRLALDVAKELKLTALANEILALALDSEERTVLRVRAVTALEEIGETKWIKQLVGLAFDANEGEASVPPRLQRTAADTVWPEYVDTERLLGQIEIRKGTDGRLKLPVLGLPGRIQRQNIALALDWMREQLENLDAVPRPFVRQFSSRAWKAIESSGVRSSFSTLIAETIGRPGGRVNWYQPSEIEGEPPTKQNRRKLVADVVDEVAAGDTAAVELLDCFLNQSDAPILDGEDAQWALERLEKSSEGQKTERCWKRVFDGIASREPNPMAEALPDFDFRDDVVEALRQTIELYEGDDNRTSTQNEVERGFGPEDIASKIQNESPSWSSVLDWCWPDSNSNPPQIALERMLAVERQTPAPLSEMSAQYLKKNDGKPSDEEHEIYVIGAILLLGVNDLSRLKDLPSTAVRNALKRLLPAFYFQIRNIAGDLYDPALTNWAEIYPDYFTEILKERVRHQLIDGRSTGLVVEMVDRYEDIVVPVLREILEDDSFDDESKLGAFRYLVDHDQSAAKSWLSGAMDALEGKVAEDSLSETDQRIVILALQYLTNRRWERLLTIFDELESGTVETILREAVEHKSGRESIVESLDASQCRDLFKIAITNCRKKQEEKLDPIFDDFPGLLRDLRRRLIELSSDRAVDALQDLEELAESHGLAREAHRLQWAKTEASQTASAPEERDPPDARSVLNLLDESRARIIRSDTDLRGIVLESLHRLEQKWQAGNRIVYLWNEQKEGRQPKHEEAHSDYVANHLQDELRTHFDLIAAREPEVEPRVQGSGPRVDLKLYAPSDSDAEAIAGITIEVKLCSNDSTVSSLTDQLVSSYLNTREPVGLQLVVCHCSDESEELRSNRGFRGHQKNCGNWETLYEELTDEADALDEPYDVEVVVLDGAHPEE